MYPPETGVDLAASYRRVGEKPVTWQRTIGAADSPLGMGKIDFLPRFAPVNTGVAYAYTRLVSDRERDVQLLAGSDDTLQVWLNGTLVHAHKVFRQVTMDDDSVKMHLKQGENSLLVKICSPAGDWALVARLTELDGAPLTKGVQYGFNTK